MTIEFSRKIFEKNDQISNFMSIRPVGAELSHVDKQTDKQADITKLSSRFSKFGENA
jgi:hypothetical protein